jgi:hypothetical protein
MNANGQADLGGSESTVNWCAGFRPSYCPLKVRVFGNRS